MRFGIRVWGSKVYDLRFGLRGLCFGFGRVRGQESGASRD